MEFRIHDLDISTGGILVIVINHLDAVKLGLHKGDRVGLTKGKKHIHVIIDLAVSDNSVSEGTIGCFEEVLFALNAKEGSKVKLVIESKPLALKYIREKLDGKVLSAQKYHDIIKAVVAGKLSESELTFFVAAGYIHGFSETETAHLTRAMIDTGSILKFKGIVADKHCTGGVAGNRTTLLVVPIVAAAGVKMPKTSSRAITSPAGTADTMEVLAPVTFSEKKMTQIVNKIGACIVWGGAINLAPADDKIIQVEHSLSVDAEGQLLASILAKKGSVGSNHVLIDIPVGEQTKIRTMHEARHLKHRFEKLGKKLGMNVKVIVTDGNEPIGNGIGPALEAKDVLKVLQRSDTRPLDLEKKAVHMAGVLLELTGKCAKGKGEKMAQQLLDSKAALKKMQQIIKAQGGNPHVQSADIPVGKHVWSYKATKSGTVKDIHNKNLARVAKFAGAPLDLGAGVYIHKHEKEKVTKGEALLTIHAENKEKLGFAKNLCISLKVIRL